MDNATNVTGTVEKVQIEKERYINITGVETCEFIKNSELAPDKICVVYHEDLDGVIGATCIKAKMKKMFTIDENQVTYIPTQYGKDAIMNFENIVNFSLVVFIDFCPSVKEINELFQRGISDIHIYDHHQTQVEKVKEEFKRISSLIEKNEEFIESIKETEKFVLLPENVTEEELKFLKLKVHFDLNLAGCTIGYDQFIEELEYNGSFIRMLSLVSNYAEDMDLWKWELINSKEMHAGLDILMQTLNLKHDPEKWYNILNGSEVDFRALAWEYPGTDFQNFNIFPHIFERILLDIGIGKIRYDNNYINKFKKAAEKGKIPLIKVGGIKMFALNNSYLASKVGNMLTEFGYPSVQYFIIHEVKDGLVKEPELVLSFRSTDDLPDVSRAAKALGGGGHRNACGVGMKLENLEKLLKSEL